MFSVVKRFQKSFFTPQMQRSPFRSKTAKTVHSLQRKEYAPRKLMTAMCPEQLSSGRKALDEESRDDS